MNLAEWAKIGENGVNGNFGGLRARNLCRTARENQTVKGAGALALGTPLQTNFEARLHAREVFHTVKYMVLLYNTKFVLETVIGITFERH